MEQQPLPFGKVQFSCKYTHRGAILFRDYRGLLAAGSSGLLWRKRERGRGREAIIFESHNFREKILSNYKDVFSFEMCSQIWEAGIEIIRLMDYVAKADKGSHQEQHAQ